MKRQAEKCLTGCHSIHRDSCAMAAFPQASAHHARRHSHIQHTHTLQLNIHTTQNITCRVRAVCMHIDAIGNRYISTRPLHARALRWWEAKSQSLWRCVAVLTRYFLSARPTKDKTHPLGSVSKNAISSITTSRIIHIDRCHELTLSDNVKPGRHVGFICPRLRLRILHAGYAPA